MNEVFTSYEFQYVETLLSPPAQTGQVRPWADHGHELAYNVANAESVFFQSGGHALSHSHVRRAHLAYRWCGEGRTEKKLVFIMPTVVRPDLPPSPARRGYFIPDRKGVAA